MPATTDARGETKPLLGARHSDDTAKSGCEEPELGSARFPFHPTAPATPLWRKLVLRLFDDQTHGAGPVDVRDLWRLEPQFRGAQAAAELKKKIPSSGRARLLRGVWAVNRRRILRLALLNAVATPFAALRPLLLLYLFRVGLPKIEIDTTQRHVRGDTWEVYVPITGIVITELVLALVRARAASIAVRIYLQMSSSLSTLITERVVMAGTPVEVLGTSQAKETPVGRKQRLTEITNMLTNNLVRVVSVPLFVHSSWIMIVRLIVSMVVFVNVVNISWIVVSAVVAAYGLLLLVEVTVGMSLATRFEVAFARRLNTIHESVMSIQMIKMNAWEDKMEHKILDARSLETSAANRLTVLGLIMKAITKESPILITALVLAMTVTSSSIIVTRTSLSSVQAFTTLVLAHDSFRCAEKVKSAFQTVVAGSHVWGKLESFLLSGADPRSQLTSRTRGSSVSATDVIAEMRGASMSATSPVPGAPPLLINVDWTVRKGELVVIHGPAGVGKSVLLSALLGKGPVQKY